MGRTEKGFRVFVKKLTGPAEDVSTRMRRIVAHHRFAAEIGDTTLRGPRCLGWEEAAGMVVFEHLDDAVSGVDLVDGGHFDTRVSERLGRSIGGLHREELRPAEMDDSPPSMPSTRPLEGLTEAEYENSSHAMRQVWRFLQQDGELHRGVERLVDLEATAPRVPSHCDLRVDQLLMSGSQTYLTDWEEFRLADPARDVGSYTGEWLYRAALDMGRPPNSGEDAGAAAVEAGSRSLDRLRPHVEAFWSGYRAARPRRDPELAVRATAFAGWHLLDRVVSGAMRWSRLPARHLAAAGVGRAALLDPERFARTLGLTHAEGGAR